MKIDTPDGREPSTASEIRRLKSLLRAVTGPILEGVERNALERKISSALQGSPSNSPILLHTDTAVALLREVLPGWWWTCGSCWLSDDATIAPDYNDPAHGERLHKEFPLPESFGPGDKRTPFDEGFSFDLRPSTGSPARSIVACILAAKIHIAAHAASNPTEAKSPITSRLLAWAPLIANGLECPAASLAMYDAVSEIERLRKDRDEAVERLANAPMLSKELHDIFERSRLAYEESKDELMRSAAAARARVAELEAALKPFGDAADQAEEIWPGVFDCAYTNQLTVGDLRRARAAYRARASAPSNGGEE